MKRYLKIGAGVVLPFALVAQVLIWVYGWVSSLARSYIPEAYGYEWWYPILFAIVIILGLIVLGFVFSLLKPVKWLKHKLDHYIMDRIPFVNKVYNFGKDISDSFITDIKEDGDLQVVEIDFGPVKMLGVLTDPKNHLVFIFSSPSPLTGFVFKTENYRILDMQFFDAVKINASLGKTQGNIWK